MTPLQPTHLLLVSKELRYAVLTHSQVMVVNRSVLRPRAEDVGAPEGALDPLPAASGLPLFFQGWNPLPTAASARGGGDIEAVLLHSAAIMARGVPRSPGCSVCKYEKLELIVSCAAAACVLEVYWVGRGHQQPSTNHKSAFCSTTTDH